MSEYGKQLAEKQKLRDMYGVNERQFRRLFLIASNSKEVTGTKFMTMLETRLDNLVYRLGFAKTRRAARQLVNHKHIQVNGKTVDIPSFMCNVGDVIEVREKSKDIKPICDSLEALSVTVPYVELDKEKKSGKLVRLPERNELPKDIDESLIVEFYNRLL